MGKLIEYLVVTEKADRCNNPIVHRVYSYKNGIIENGIVRGEFDDPNGAIRFKADIQYED